MEMHTGKQAHTVCMREKHTERGFKTKDGSNRTSETIQIKNKNEAFLRRMLALAHTYRTEQEAARNHVDYHIF